MTFKHYWAIRVGGAGSGDGPAQAVQQALPVELVGGTGASRQPPDLAGQLRQVPEGGDLGLLVRVRHGERLAQQGRRERVSLAHRGLDIPNDGGEGRIRWGGMGRGVG